MSLANNDFLRLTLSLNPVLFHCYALGHYNALDSYGRAVTVAGSPAWERTERGHAFHPRTNGRLLVADSGAAPELRVTTGTLISLSPGFDARTTSFGKRFIDKRDGGGIAYSFLFNTVANNILFASALNTSGSTSVKYAGAKMVAVSFVSGDFPIFYADGEFVSLGSAAVTLDQNDADLYIGNVFNGTGPNLSPILASLIFNTVLDLEVISDLHRLFLQDFLGVPAAPLRTISLPKADQNGALLYLAGSTRSDGKIIDYGPNGLDATRSGVVSDERDAQSGVMGQRFHGKGGGILTVSNDPSFETAARTFSFLGSRRSAGESTSRAIFDGNFYYRTDGEYLYRVFTSNGRWDFQTRPVGRVMHTHLEHDGLVTSSPNGWLNGRSWPKITGAAPTGSLSSDAGHDITLGNLSDQVHTMDGFLGDVKRFDKILSESERRAEYLQYGTRSIELAPRRAYPVTLANKTSGQVGPWRIVDGTWAYRDDGIRRKVVALANGSTAWIPGSQAYGAWHFRFKKVSDTGNVILQFVSAKSDVSTVSGQNTYLFNAFSDESVHIFRYDNGAFASAVLGSAPGYISLNTEYEVFITRAFDGYSTMWIRGGVYTNWTFVDDGTDNTHTTTRYMVLDVDLNDEFGGNLLRFPLGDTLDPNDVPAIADAV